MPLSLSPSAFACVAHPRTRKLELQAFYSDIRFVLGAGISRSIGFFQKLSFNYTGFTDSWFVN